MSLYVRPENIRDLIGIESGRFVIDESATPEQVAEFEKWREQVEAEERELEAEFII